MRAGAAGRDPPRDAAPGRGGGGGGRRTAGAHAPLTGIPGRHGSRRPPAAALVAAAALLAACAAAAAAPQAHADDHPLTVEISTGEGSLTNLTTVPFAAKFSRPVDASTLDASDFNVTSGEVRDLRPALHLNATVGGAGPGQLSSPGGVAVDDSSGTIYVASTGHGLVKIFGPDLGHVANLSGFPNPHGVEVDGSGSVYVADAGGSVRVFDSDLNETGIINASSVPAQNFGPRDVAVDASGTIYVADSSNGKVSAFHPNRTHAADLPGQHAPDNPRSIAADGPGRIYVASAAAGNATVQIFHPNRTHAAAHPGPFVDPQGVAAGGSGSVYVADGGPGNGSGRVHVTDAAGGVLTFDPAGTPIAALPGTFRPSAVAADGSGRVYVADRGNSRVHVLDHVYRFDVAGAAEGRLEVSLPAGSVRDGAGNGNAASNATSIRIDTERPIPTISAALPGPTNASTISFTVDFGEGVAGFAPDDIVLSNTTAHGGVENFANASAGAYGFDVSPTRDGTILVDVPEGAAEDAAGNPSAEAARYSVERDATPPAPAIAPAAPGPTGLQVVPFTLEFDEPVSATPLEASIDASNGTVQDMRIAPQHSATFGGSGSGGVQFNQPYGVAVGSSGNIYVADRQNHIVQVFDSSRNHTATIDNSFNSPSGVAVDGSGNVYVANTFAGHVQVFDSSGNYVANLPGQLSFPFGIAIDGSGNIYVAESEGTSVAVFDSDRNRLPALAGLDRPRGVAVDGSGSIYVAEWGGRSVAVFDPDRNRLPDLQGSFNRPSGVAADGQGNIYVADPLSNRVWIFDSDRSHVADLPGPLRRPYGVAADGQDSIYVADRDTGTVRIFSAAYAFGVADAADGQALTVRMPAGRVQDRAGNANEDSNPASIRIDRTGPVPTVSTAEQNPTDAETVGFLLRFDEDINDATLAAPDMSASSGTVQGPRAAPQINSTFGARGPGSGPFDGPAGVAAGGPSGRVYVADAGNASVGIFDSAGNYEGALPGPFASPAGVAVDASGGIYVADSGAGRIRIFDPEGRPAGAIDGQLVSPRGVAVDGSGRVYVADAGNASVRIFDHAREHAGDLPGPFGSPSGIALDGSGRIYVADAGNAGVRIFDRDRGHAGDLPGPFGGPSGIALDGSGRIYVADNGSVRMFDRARAPAGDLPGPLAGPSGIALDGSGRIYVADNGSRVVRVFDTAYAFNVTGPGDTQNLTVSLPAGRVLDAAGNGNEESNTVGIYVNRTGRTPAVSSAQQSPTNAETIRFAVEFGDAVTGFNASDVELSGTAGRGGVENFMNASATAYSFEVSPASDGTILVDIPEGAALSAQGRPSYAADRFYMEYDGTPPVPRVAAATDGPTNLAAVPFSMAFSEPVNASTLEASDVDASPWNATDLRGVWPRGADIGSYGTGADELKSPHGVAVNASGHAYVADTGNDRVSVFNGTGHVAGHISASFGAPIDVAVGGPYGRVYVADSVGNKVWVFNSTWHHVHDIRNSFDAPSGVAVDSSGNVYVADRYKDRVHVFDHAWKYARDVGGPYNDPNGVAVDSSGRVYVADSNNNTVHVYDAAGQRVANITNSFNYPFAVDVDPAGNVFVADAFNNRVAVFDSARQHVANLTRSFSVVTGVGVDPSTGGVYASGRDNHRVTLFDAAHAFDVAGAAEGRLEVSLPAGRVLDMAGNPNVASNAAGILIDRTAPTPTVALSGPADASTINFTVTFGENVSGFELADIVLSGDAMPGDAYNLATYDNMTYNFSAAPAENGTVAVAIPENAAADSAGNGNEAAQLSTAYSGAPAIAPVPTVTADAQQDPTSESPIGFTVTFSRNVTGFDASGIEITGAATGIDAGSFAAVNATTYTFAVSPSTDGTVTVDIPAGAAAGEAYGTASGAAARFSVQYAAAPVPTITSAAGPGPTSESPIGFTVTFSKNVTGFDASGIEITGAATGIDAGSFAAVNAATYTFAVSPSTDGTVTVDIPAGAAAGEAYGTASGAAARFSVQYNGAVPVPTITSGAGPGPTAESPIAFTVTFSENVTGFNASGIEISGSAGAGAAADGFDNATATTYTFTVSPAADGTVTVDIPAGVARDADGNGNEAARFSIQYNGAVPVPTITSGAGPGPTSISPIAFTVTFSENVTGFNASGIEISGSAGAGAAADGFDNATATTYTFTVSPAADGTVTVDIPAGVARDADGNGNEAARFSVQYNGAVPVPTITSGAGPGPTSISPIAFTVTFSENVTGFNASGIMISGSAGAGAAADGFDNATATTYTFTVSPAADGTVTVDIPAGVARDADGNGNEAARFSVQYNGAVPVPTITSGAGPGPTAESPIAFTVTFSENVTGFNASGIEISGSAGAGAAADGFDNATATTYTFTVSPAADGTVTVDIPAGVARDADGNGNEAARFSVQYNGAVPVPTITSGAGPGPATESPIAFTVTFSENVTGFNASGIEISGSAGAGAAAANFDNATATTYTFAVSPSTVGTVTVDIPAGVARDADGNGNEAARFSVQYTGAVPVPTITSGAGPGPTSISPIGFTVTFSENVTGFNETGIMISGSAGAGAAAANFDNASAPTYAFDVVPASDGTVRIDIPAGAARDADGNGNEAAAGLSVVLDTAGPAAAVAPAQAGPTGLAAVPFAVKFSEGVNASALDESDIAASSGTVQDLRMVLRYNRTIGGENSPSADPGKFNRPFGLAVDGSGYLYVAEMAGKRIQVFDPAGNYSATFGGPAADPDDPEPGRFQNIRGIAVDASSGRIYAADPAGDRVLVYGHDGEYLADLPGAPETPVALAVNASGHVYVSNAGNGTVQIFDSSGNWAAALNGTFDGPRGVAFGGPAGLVYAADRDNGRIRVFDLNGMPAGDFGTNGSGAGQFIRPVAVAVDDLAGRIYVAERGNQRVQVFDSNWSHASYLSGFPNALDNPRAVAADAPSGRVYVADTEHHRVLVFDAAYEFSVANPDDRQTLNVSLPAGRTRDAAGNDNAESNTASIEIDRTRPIPTVATSGPADSATINFTVTFSEDVTGFNASGIELSGSADPYRVANFAPVNSTTYTFYAAPAYNGTVIVGIRENAAEDDAGNGNVAAQFSVNFTGASPFPVPTITSGAQPGPARVSPIAFTVTFSENVTGFNETGIMISGSAGAGATVDDFVNDSARTYTFDVEPTSAGIVLVDIPEGAAVDSDGNGNEAAAQFSILYTGALPVPTITSAAQPGPARVSPIAFTVTFSENVTGFNETGIMISGSAGAGAAANFSGSATTYTFDVAPSTVGTVLVDIPAGAARDADGNGNEAAAQFSILYTGALPVPTITSAAQPGPARVSPIAFTVTFSEDVTGFNASGIKISGSAGAGAAVDDFVNASARTYTFDVAPSTVGTVLVDIPEGAAVDSDGNGNEAAEQFSIEYTGALPVPTITSAAQPGPARVSPIGFTVTFSEDVTGFNETGIMISGSANPGNATSFVNASARTYTFDVAPSTVGTVLVDIPGGAARDADGNGNEAAEQFSIRYTGTVPVPTITSDAGPGPATESPIAFTVTFSEDVTGFNETGIMISGPAGAGAAVDDFVNASARTYTFDVAPSTVGTVLVDIPGGAAVDSDGNGNEAAEQFSIEYTGALPVPTITSGAGPGPATESPIAFTVTFSENVTGFSASGIEISGIASGIDAGSFDPVNATTYAFTVSPTTNGTVTVDVPANVAADAGGNNNTAAAQLSIEYNGAPPAPAAAPVPTITSGAGPGPATESPIAFTVTFSENVTGFSASGIEISGIASGIDAGSFDPVNATTYAFTVSPTTNGTVTVDVPANVAADAGGNNNTAAARFSIEYNGAPPATQLAVESAAITGPHTITIRYDADADADGSAYGPIVVGGTPRSATLAGAGTDTHVLQFGGDPAARDATGSMAINQTAVTDPAGRPLGNDATYQLELADGQAPALASAVLDLTAGENGLLTVTFDEAAAAAPDAPLSGGDIVVRGDGGEVALSGSDVPSVASGRAGGTEFALDISGAKRIELNAADLGPAAIELPEAFVSDAPGNPYAPGRQPAPLAYAPDPSPPVLVKAAFNLAPGSGNAGRLVITFDEAATAPGVQSFPGMIEIRGRSWGGDAAVTLSAADVISVESGRDGDRTFALLASDRARSLLDAAAFSDPESTTLLLPAGFVTNGRAAHAPERAPLDVARDPDGPSFLLAFVLDGSSVAAVYSEPVLAVPSHYANITVDGAAAAGNGGGASEAAAYGNNVVVSWNANASTTASAGSAVGFDLSANVTDAFGNPVVNPGEKSTGGPVGTGQAGKRPVQVGVFARGPADPSAEAARLGAAAFNAVSEERGYRFYVSVSEHDLPAGAPGAAALRGAHNGGSGPSLYVGPASDTALAGMAGYASENGITIISHSSAARPLAVGGDPIFRMEPGAAHLARVLATEVARGGYGAIVPVVQAGLRGPDYGLLESLESDLGPLGIPFAEPVAFAGGGGGAAAAPIGDAVASAAGSGTARSVAVVYMGSDMELAAMAGSAPADGPIRERSAWFAAGGAGAGAGSGVAASPAITADAAAIQLARDVRLSAVQFAVERNSMTDYIDRIAAPRGPATSATPAYAAYEAVRALGGALVGAGGDPSLARGNVAGAANLEGGPLGRTGMDGNGDLRLPVTYGIWSVSDAAAEWARAPELLRGLDACGIDLEKPALALPSLSAGSTSRPARQTVTNIGTGPMPAVSVSATDWAQFLGGVPVQGLLPFSYTEMAVGLGGASPRPADSTPLAAGTEIPGGTPPGGSVDVDFRINLGGLDALEADFISQTVTFVVNCS